MKRSPLDLRSSGTFAPVSLGVTACEVDATHDKCCRRGLNASRNRFSVSCRCTHFAAERNSGLRSDRFFFSVNT